MGLDARTVPSTNHFTIFSKDFSLNNYLLYSNTSDSQVAVVDLLVVAKIGAPAGSTYWITNGGATIMFYFETVTGVQPVQFIPGPFCIMPGESWYGNCNGSSYQMFATGYGHAEPLMSVGLS